jgi:hypothetical protein
MAEEAATPLEFKDREVLEAWLRTQPREVAVIIAARAALRVLPVAASDGPKRGDDATRLFAGLIAALFRGTALARVAGKYPSRANELRAAAFAAASAIDAHKTDTYQAAPRANDVASAAAGAARTAGAADYKADVYDAADAAFVAARAAAYHDDAYDDDANADVWSALSADATFVLAQNSSNKLVEQPLWPRGAPNWARTNLQRLRAFLLNSDDWGVWTEWYDSRLSGSPVPEAIELVYATVPLEKWDEGPAAANAWIKEQLRRLQGQRGTETKEPTKSLEFKSGKELEAWLRSQPHEVAIIIAARAAMRVLPVTALDASTHRRDAQPEFGGMIAAVFRAAALARVAGKYRIRANELRVSEAISAAALAADAARAAYIADAVSASHAAARAVYATDAAYAVYAASAATRAAEAFSAFAIADSIDTVDAAAAAFREIAWRAVSSDADFLLAKEPSWYGVNSHVSELAEHPLWPGQTPDIAELWWRHLRAALPSADDWAVWIEWYEARLKGGPVQEEIELVYATVPLEKWDEGPAAANAWIKAKLTRVREKAAEADLPAVPTPPAIPQQLPGPHVEIDRETGVIVPARPESLDAEGNNLVRLRAHHPQILRLAGELLAKVSQNEQPELFSAVKSYFENVNRELGVVDFERLWGEGIYLEEAAVAAERRINNGLREPLGDAALSALQALLRIHGPFILATKAGLENLAFANAYEMRPEERDEQHAATLELAQVLKNNADIVAPETAQMVAHFATLRDSTVHPERSAAFKVGLTRNVAIVLTAAASIGGIIATMGPATGLPVAGVLALPMIEGYKKSKPFLDVAGLVTKGLDTLSESDARAAWEKLSNVSFERYRQFVLDNEQLLRRLGGSQRQMRWLHEHIEWLKQTGI